MPILVLLAGFVLSAALEGAVVRQGALGPAVNEPACRVTRTAAAFESSDRQAFFVFTATQVKEGDTVDVEWTGPDGSVVLAAPYRGLPAAPALCFITHLPIAGFEAAERPGAWTVRVSVNGAPALTRSFRIAPDPNAGRVHIKSVTRTSLEGTMEVAVEGGGFDAECMVYIAQYKDLGGWRYLAALHPASRSPARLTVRYAALPPGEYMIIVRNADASFSQPARLLIATEKSYKLPFAAGAPWTITQTPYGAFSHYNRSVHAWDLAPAASRCVVAMRAGVAYTFDRGMGQTQHLRSFGNYITVEHEDGEFSHYAHLAKGTFQVQNGQRVAQGQALALAGNSGYTFGQGGGTHLHVHVTRNFAIASQSIPFRFEELDGPPRRYASRQAMSSNTSPLCVCQTGGLPGKPGAGPRGAAAASTFTGSIPVTEWWERVVVAPRGAPRLEVELAWEAEDADLDLHLMSPSGKHYGWYGLREGYSGKEARPETLSIPAPEAGSWRIAVRAMRGGPGAIPFQVETVFGERQAARGGSAP